jgi:hypothetical protein
MKVIFVTRKGCDIYSSSKHLNKVWHFLYWHSANSENSLLVAGNGNYGLKDSTHHSLLVHAKSSGCVVPSNIMDGAGNNIEDGKISGWRSTGFNVTTPENLRPLIIKALGATE